MFLLDNLLLILLSCSSSEGYSHPLCHEERFCYEGSLIFYVLPRVLRHPEESDDLDLCIFSLSLRDCCIAVTLSLLRSSAAD